jgi:hypothetical protein
VTSFKVNFDEWLPKNGEVPPQLACVLKPERSVKVWFLNGKVRGNRSKFFLILGDTRLTFESDSHHADDAISLRISANNR